MTESRRDAAGEDHKTRWTPEGESGRKGHDPTCVLPSAHKGPCRPRSPQGEDHEAGIPDAALDAAEQAVHACRRYALGHPSRKAIYVEARDEAYDVLKAALPHLSRCPAPHREDHEACPTCEQFERHMADVHGRTPEALDHESAADRPSPERAKVARLRSALERVESHGSGIAVTIAREALAEFGEGP
jgi:hypothetical protein